MTKIKIGKRFVGPDCPTYILAEIGNNHNADFDTAKALIKAAHGAGCDGVKFQTFKALDVVNPLIPANAYPGWDVSDRFDYWYQFVDSIAMPFEWYDELIAYTRDFGMDFISTPASMEALHFLAGKKIDALKIASMDLNNIPFLKEADGFGLPVIMSTGMATIEEIEESVAVFKKSPLVLLHCVSNYPLRPEDASLLNIHLLRDKFDHPIGFSNHSLGYDLDIVATAMGACMIEKHFTLDRHQPAVAEHHISMQPVEMKELIDKVRLIERSLGSYERRMTPDELENRQLARRSIRIHKDMKKGEKITSGDIVIIRPADGIAPKYLNEVIGKMLTRDVSAYESFSFEDLRWKREPRSIRSRHIT